MKPNSIRYFLTICFLASIFSAHANAADQVLLTAAKSEEAKVIDTLQTLVSMESGTMDAPGLSRIADHLQERLTALGAQVERLKVSGAKGDALIGRYTGSGTRRLMIRVALPSSCIR